MCIFYGNRPPVGIQLHPLKSHLDLEKVNSVWPLRTPDSLSYLERMAKYNPNIGAYKDDGTMVAWLLRYFHGYFRKKDDWVIIIFIYQIVVFSDFQLVCLEHCKLMRNTLDMVMEHWLRNLFQRELLSLDMIFILAFLRKIIHHVICSVNSVLN